VTARASLWLPVAVYMAAIFVASSLPAPPALPGELSDKSGHVLLYFGLGALLVRALAGGWRRPVSRSTAIVAAAIAAAYGVSDELHQYFVPTRHMDAADVLADAIGAGLAAALLHAWSRLSDTARRRPGVADSARNRGV
jgi:VanZ family protein